MGGKSPRPLLSACTPLWAQYSEKMSIRRIVMPKLEESPFSARSKSHSRSSASPCCLLLVAALRTRLEPLFPALRGRKSTPPTCRRRAWRAVATHAVAH